MDDSGQGWLFQDSNLPSMDPNFGATQDNSELLFDDIDDLITANFDSSQPGFSLLDGTWESLQDGSQTYLTDESFDLLPTAQIPAQPQQIMQTPTQVVAPTVRTILSPTTQILSPPAQILSPTQRVVSPTQEVISPKQTQMQQIVSQQKQQIVSQQKQQIVSQQKQVLTNVLPQQQTLLQVQLQQPQQQQQPLQQEIVKQHPQQPTEKGVTNASVQQQTVQIQQIIQQLQHAAQQVSAAASKSVATTVANNQQSKTIQQVLVPQIIKTESGQSVPVVVTTSAISNVVVENQEKMRITRIPGINNSQGPQLPKGEKRTNHNAIEKRYRFSINNKILELKEMVVGNDAKIQKSGILQKAIDLVKYLRKTVENLKHENRVLKTQVERLKNGLPIDDLEIKVEPLTPPPSEYSSPSRSPSSSSSGVGSPGPYAMEDDNMSDTVPSPRGMLDRTRIGLCIFLFAVLSFNPFGSLITNQYSASSEYGTGRTLLAVDDQGEESWYNWMFPTMLIWFINVFVAFFVLARILIYGEPVTQAHSKESVSFWRHKKQADLDLARGDYASATSQLRLALTALGRPLPTSKVDLASCLAWNCLRHVLNRLWIGRLLVRGRIRSSGIKLSDVQTSAKNAALIYHKLHQLYMTGKSSDGLVHAVNMALSAMNLAEVAGDAISKDSLAEIYVTTAVHIKTDVHRRLHIISRYFLSRARHACAGQEGAIPPSLQWLFHPAGHRFFVCGNWNCDAIADNMFTTTGNCADPLSHISRAFREYLLDKALYTLVAPTQKQTNTNRNADVTGNSDGIAQNQCSDVCQYLQLLSECSETAGAPQQASFAIGSNMSAASGSDPVSKWWCNAILVATHWLQGDDTAAERLYSSVETLPTQLQDNEDPLPVAVQLAFKARRIFLSDSKKDQYNEECVRLCNKSSKYLQKSLSLADQPNQNITQGIQLLVCDWLLSTRTAVWQKQTNNQGTISSTTELSTFQQDLASLRKLANVFKAAMASVSRHEATARLMAGANPKRTQQLLDRSLRRRVINSAKSAIKDEDIKVSDRDHGAALMMACKHLPTQLLSSPGQRERMLTEAVQSFERVGDRRSLQDCQQMLISLGRTKPALATSCQSAPIPCC